MVSNSLVGYSQRINDPAFKRHHKERFQRNIKVALIIFPITLAISQIIPFFSKDFSHKAGLITSCIIGVTGFVYYLVNGIVQKTAKPWDGEVIDKKIIKRWREPVNDYDHIIVFRLESGRRKKKHRTFDTAEPNQWDMMTYLNVGDKVRYHGKLDFYEKYDKSSDVLIPCAGCGRFTDIRHENCPSCCVPLIKP